MTLAKPAQTGRLISSRFYDVIMEFLELTLSNVKF